MLKRRARKPLAVMMGSLPGQLHVTGCEDEWQLLASQARPSPCCASEKAMIGRQNPN